MTTTYRLHINDLTTELLDSIKAKFRDKEIKIIVSDDANETKSAFEFWAAKEEDLYEDYKP